MKKVLLSAAIAGLIAAPAMADDAKTQPLTAVKSTQSAELGDSLAGGLGGAAPAILGVLVVIGGLAALGSSSGT